MRSSTSILLVEDDQIDAMTVIRSFNDLHVTNTLHVVQNGEDALQVLHDPLRETPCLILLDLKMPRMSGLEFLQKIKHNEHLKKIPVVILTTSKDPQDKQACFALGVAGYMVKPLEYQQFVHMMSILNRYWTCSEMPEDAL